MLVMARMDFGVEPVTKSRSEYFSGAAVLSDASNFLGFTLAVWGFMQVVRLSAADPIRSKRVRYPKGRRGFSESVAAASAPAWEWRESGHLWPESDFSAGQPPRGCICREYIPRRFF